MSGELLKNSNTANVPGFKGEKIDKLVTLVFNTRKVKQYYYHLQRRIRKVNQ